MYYSYDPEDGIEFHDTAEEAKARAEKALEDAEFRAADSDWHWSDNEDEISWGEVRGKVSLNDREMTPEEKAENPEWSSIRNPTLDDVVNAERTNACRERHQRRKKARIKCKIKTVERTGVGVPRLVPCPWCGSSRVWSYAVMEWRCEKCTREWGGRYALGDSTGMRGARLDGFPSQNPGHEKSDHLSA